MSTKTLHLWSERIRCSPPATRRYRRVVSSALQKNIPNQVFPTLGAVFAPCLRDPSRTNYTKMENKLIVSGNPFEGIEFNPSSNNYWAFYFSRGLKRVIGRFASLEEAITGRANYMTSLHATDINDEIDEIRTTNE